jgi:putative transcriptional regulator
MQVNITQGQLLHSTAALAGTYFENSTILLAEVNESGALGFVINKLFGKSLNDLVAYSHCCPYPFFEGGPVDQEHLYIIHRAPILIADGTPIVNGLFFGGNFQQATQAINQQWVTTHALKLFVGYCGWDANELEAEIAEGSWEQADANNDLVFCQDYI